MKSFTHVAFVTALASGSVAACSSNPTSNTEDSGGTSSAGNLSYAGTGVAVAGSSTTGGSGIIATGGSANSTGGSAVTTGGITTTGGTGATGGAGTAGSSSGGMGGASGGSAGSANGGAGGSGPLPPYMATCGTQKYMPTATPGAACVTTMVPEEQLIASFEDAGVAPGWGVYPNVDGQTGFMPTTATPMAGGANSTTQALGFKVTSLPQGIKVQVGFGMQCQDVRTFKGLSFWAKGTIEGATQPFIVTANTLVIQIGSEKSVLGGCQGAGCAAAPPDKRVTISADWREYRIPFDCFGDAKVFDGYYTNILFNAFGPNSNFSIDEVGYY